MELLFRTLIRLMIKKGIFTEEEWWSEWREVKHIDHKKRRSGR